MYFPERSLLQLLTGQNNLNYLQSKFYVKKMEFLPMFQYFQTWNNKQHSHYKKQQMKNMNTVKLPVHK